MRLDRVLPPLAPCLVILVMLSPSSAVAEGAEGERAEAEATFDSLYGDDVAKVTRTRDKKDDVALAARLLETARGQDVQPVLAAVLAEKAITLGAAHPDGYDTAVDAADLMLEVAPERSADAYEHLIDLREQQHRAAKGLDKIGAAETLIETFLMAADARLDGGEAAEALGVMRRASRLARSIRSDRQDEIQARMDRATARLKAERQAEAQEKKLQAAPDDAATRNALVRLCVRELDDPERALKHLNDSCEDDLKKYVPAAAKGVAAAPELACMDLGEWYRGLADGASDAAKAPLLRRAKAYYARFLALHAAEDLARSQAALALKKVEADLAKLAAVTEVRVVGPGRWVDLLPLVKIEDDLNKKNQKCRWRDDGLWIQGSDFVKVAMPCIPHGDYQLQITFMRPSGRDISSISVYLPVGPKPADVSWTNNEHGGNIGGVKPKPEKGQPGLVLPKQEHTADITVRVRGSLADITVLFDGKPHLHWQGPVTAVSNSWNLHEPKRVGFGEAYGNTLLKRYRLRMLSGKALLLRPLRKSAGRRPGAPKAGEKDGEASLVANAGFEETIAGNPANRTQWGRWGAWSWGGEYALASETRPEYVHSGKRSARITCTGETGRIGVISSYVPVAEDAKTYTFAVWARGEGENELFVNFEGGARGELRKRIGPDWEKVTVTGTPKPDGKRFRVFLYAIGKGTIWLDDASLEPVK